jgi:uncharacterized delta-60 repeat protein
VQTIPESFLSRFTAGLGRSRRKQYRLTLEQCEQRICCNAGDLDTSFNHTGTQLLGANLGGGVGTYATSVALQNGGSLLVGTDYNGNVAVARLNPDGTRDTGYGSGSTFSGNIFTYPAGFRISGNSSIEPGPHAAIQPNNGLAVITVVEPDSSHFQVIRLTTNGALDTSFGNQGVTTLPFVDSSSELSIATRGNGQIVVASNSHVTQLNANGSIDTSFGDNEVTLLPVNFWAAATAIQPDGEVVLAGTTPSNSVALVRLTATGAVETNLGNAGLVTYDLVGRATAVTVIQANGQIVMTGYQTSHGPDFVTRLNTNTTPDTNFGSGGTVMLPQFAIAKAVGVEWDGKILVSGSSALITSVSNEVVVRLTTAGALDSSFASGGVKTISFGHGSSAYSEVLVTLTNGVHKLLVSGGTGGSYTAALLLLDSSNGGSSGGGSSASHDDNSGGGPNFGIDMIRHIALLNSVATRLRPTSWGFHALHYARPVPLHHSSPASTPPPALAPFAPLKVRHRSMVHHPKVKHHAVNG